MIGREEFITAPRSHDCPRTGKPISKPAIRAAL
jgi:hypothetical protein